MRKAKLRGKIRKRGDKFVFDNCDRVNRVRETFDTEAEATKALMEYSGKVLLGLNPKRAMKKEADNALSIDAAIAKYRATRPKAVAKRHEKSFLKLYHYLYDAGVYYTDEVKAEHLEALQTHMQDDLKYKWSYVNWFFGAYKQFFVALYRWEYISRNPTVGIKCLKGPTEKKKLWPREVLDKIMAEITEWAVAPLLFQGLTGWRPSQVSGLKFGDVDFKARTAKTQSYKGGVYKEITVALNDAALAVIRSQMQGRIGSPDRLVFSGPKGNRFKSKSLWRALYDAQERLGISGYCPYGLRHTFGTRLVAEGVHLKIIAELLGHSDTRTTERYVGDVSAGQREAAEKDSWAK